MADRRNDYTMQTVARVFNDILDRDGKLDPAAIHDEVAAEDHPLHHRYEWDDTLAGRKYRIQQITSDIRLVKVQFVDQSSGEMKSVRAYSSLKYSQQSDARGYIETDKLIASDPVAAGLMSKRLMRQITTLKQQFGHLQDFNAVVRRELLGEEEQTA